MLHQRSMCQMFSFCLQKIVCTTFGLPLKRSSNDYCCIGFIIQDAINELHGKELLGKRIQVDWAFVKPAIHAIARAGERPRKR